MSGQEGEGEGSEEEIKDSLLRQWKEGRLQVAEEKGRQIPTIIERRSLPKRQSWPLLSSQPPATLLPDLSQPPPGFQHLQPGQHSLPLPTPSSLASSITTTTTQQASPGGQYREQVLKALLAGTKLGEVVDALLAVPAATLGKSSTVFEREPVPMSGSWRICPGILTLAPKHISEGEAWRSGWNATFFPRRTKGKASSHFS